MYITKGNKVKEILNSLLSPELNGYVMFSDNWINEHNKILYNQEGDSLIVTDFVEIKRKEPINHYLPNEGYCNVRYSCVKLNKDVNVGDMLYTDIPKEYENKK